ncbi:AMP-dependent synthetase/ligase [Salinibius halmophilus]|uniref:AMP-dependent synthetase/ligase n=1 Tax=Salinibius halmophilus TaxID=1853216 RepID=UPI0018F5DE22|nr:long-chain fatty acid--CoA ligase [Salinibius halmophilus]
MQHPIVSLQAQVASQPNAHALSFQAAQQWHHLTYQALWQQVETLAGSITQVAELSPIAIFSNNCPEWIVSDLAAMATGHVVVPIYATSTAEQLNHILTDSAAKLVIIGEQAQYDVLVQAQPEGVETVVVISNKVVMQTDLPYQQFTWQQFVALDCPAATLKTNDLDKLATLIYTSGTTGNPKGVMLDFKALASTIEQHQQELGFKPQTRSLAMLPLSHIFERAWSLFVLCSGGHNYILRDPQALRDALPEVQPQAMCVVPRVLEKVYSTVHDKVAHASPVKKLLFKFSIAQGERAFATGKQGVLYRLADKLVLSKLRATLGGKLELVPCGGAKLDEKVNQFFQALGVPVMCGYGLTETTATVCFNRANARSIADNGSPLPKVEVKIGAKNEVLVRGDTVMRGYYNLPTATSEAFEDGWFKTGDAGYLDEHGRLVITERIKELMKTSNGKYIAPQRIEGVVGKDSWIEQIAVVADSRHFVSALIVPAFEALEAWANEQQIAFKDKMELLQNHQVREHFNQRLKELQSELANFEQIKKFTLLSREFSMELGEITPTLKLRRKVIMERFQQEIEAMYKPA